jgi:transposase
MSKVRTVEPQRSQVEIRFDVPEDMLPPTHPARVLWTLLGRLDLGRFTDGYRSVEGSAGRGLLSPRMMLTLWLYAISDGVGSAREIERLTNTHTAYRWIVGTLKVSHHKLSGFRVGCRDAFDALFTDVVSTLLHANLVSLSVMAQDGTRVRAAASAPSFRTYGSLLECREQAALHLKAVLAAADDPEYTRAQHTCREAAARDFENRVEAAITTVEQMQKPRDSSDKKSPRASTTDAEARIMKMGDGGFRPAYNVQYAVVGDAGGGPRTIVGVQVTNVGSDMGSLSPMADQVEKRTGVLPETVLADGGHAKGEDIAELRRRGVDVIVPPHDRAKSIDQLKAEGADPEIIAWREQMETEEAKQLYRMRAGLCELANAHQKSHQAITEFLVRGIDKVTCVILMSGISANLLAHAAYLLSS